MYKKFERDPSDINLVVFDVSKRKLRAREYIIFEIGLETLLVLIWYNRISVEKIVKGRKRPGWKKLNVKLAC